MALGDMVSELRGSLPKLPFAYTKTLVNRAWRQVRESSYWSFQLFEANWISPPLVNTGTVTVTQGSPTIVFDNVTAVPALLAAQIAQPYSLLTQRQFRVGSGTIYSIIGLDPAFNTNGIATLDRPYADFPSGAGQAYQIYQLYYPAQYKDVLTYMTIRNMQMFMYLNTTSSRMMIDTWDPQRTWYQFPTHAVPLGLDLRGQGIFDSTGRDLSSGTIGFPLFELWGQPVTNFTYQLYGLRRGVDLVNLTDTLPIQVGEDLVLARARAYAYEWAEANKANNPRDDGPDYKFLQASALATYKDLLIRYRKQDKEYIDNFFSVRYYWTWPNGWGFYNTLAGTAGPYTQM